MAQNSSLAGVAFKLQEHKIIWHWAALQGWTAPIHWDHEIHDEVAGVSLRWNGLTDFSIWKCGRTGDTVAENQIGREVARGKLADVLEVVAKMASQRSA
jgi:hypothetical protein